MIPALLRAHRATSGWHLVRALGPILGLGVLGVIAWGLSTGPPAGFTHAPGEGLCTECHDSFGEEPNRGPGTLILEHPSRYEPGQLVTITVRVEHQGQRRWGFQLTALTSDTLQPAGEFQIADPMSTQLVRGANGRLYVEHTREGTFAGQPDRAQWTVLWRAPERDLGLVTFYAAGNAADGDGTRLGDWIYATESPIAPPSFPAVTLRFPKGGERFFIGQPVLIRWDASTNVASFDLLLVPRPGALPVPIISGLSAERRDYVWIVPDLASESAHLILLAFNEAGFALAESKPFRIVPVHPGDVNGDGRVDAEDYRALVRILSGKAPPTPAADVDRDGAITAYDLLRLLEALLGLRPL